MRSRGKGWFKTQMNKLQWSLYPEETRTELWSLILLAGVMCAEAPSKRPKSSSSDIRPQWRAGIITCYRRLVSLYSIGLPDMYNKFTILKTFASGFVKNVVLISELQFKFCFHPKTTWRPLEYVDRCFSCTVRTVLVCSSTLSAHPSKPFCLVLK